MKNGILRFAALAALLVGPGAAPAAIINYDFTGTVSLLSDSNNHFSGKFVVGSPVSGAFSFDDAAVPGFGSSSTGAFYRGGFSGRASATINSAYGFAMQANEPADEIDVLNQFGPETFEMRKGAFASVPTNFDPNLTISEIFLNFQASGNPLKLSTIQLAKTGDFQISGNGPGGFFDHYFIDVSVSSLQQASVVPEPSTLALAMTGAAGLLGIGWRRWAL
jgi:hypothetical protein